MTCLPSYSTSLEERKIHMKYYKQCILDKFLCQNTQNNTTRCKELKRDVSNLNKYIYLLHKQSSKAKLKIEKENSYCKSVKITENLSYYNTILCSTNKFVLNTYAFNQTQGDQTTKKKKHYETKLHCCKDHKQVCDPFKELDLEILEDDSSYKKHYIKTKDKINLRTSTRKSTEDLNKNKGKFYSNFGWKSEGKFLEKKGKKEGYKRQLHDVNTKRDIMQNRCALGNCREEDKNYKDVFNNNVRNNQLKYNAECLCVENVRLKEPVLRQNIKRETDDDNYNELVNIRNQSGIGLVELSRIKNKEIQENIVEKFKFDSVFPMNRNLTDKEQLYIKIIQRTWRMYRINKNVIHIQRCFRNHIYQSAFIINKVHSSNSILINKLLWDNSYQINISSITKLINYVIKIQKNFRDFINIKHLKLQYFLDQEISKIQTAWRRHIRRQRHKPFGNNEDCSKNVKKDNIIIKIPIVLKRKVEQDSHRSNIEDNHIMPSPIIKGICDTEEINKDINPLFSPFSKVDTKNISKEKSVINNVIDYSTEFSNNITRHIEETSFNKYTKNGKNIYIGLKKPKNLRVSQNKNVLTNNNLKDNMNNRESHSNEENLSNYSNINKSQINSLSIFPDITINSRNDKHLLTSSIYLNEYPNISNDKDDKNLTESVKELSEYSKILSIKNQEGNVFNNTPENFYYDEKVNLLALSSIQINNNVVNNKKENINVYRICTSFSTKLNPFYTSRQIVNNSTIVLPEVLENQNVNIKNFFYNDNNCSYTKVTKTNLQSIPAKIIQRFCFKKRNFKSIHYPNLFDCKIKSVYIEKSKITDEKPYIKHKIIEKDNINDSFEEDNNDKYSYRYLIYEYKIISSEKTTKQILNKSFPERSIALNMSREANDANIKDKFDNLVKQKNTDFSLERSEEVFKRNEYDVMKLKYKDLIKKIKKTNVETSNLVELKGERDR